MLVTILSIVEVVQTDWYNGPLRSNLTGSCLTNPTDLNCSNDCPLVTNPSFGSFSNQFCKYDGNVFYLFQGKLRLRGVFRTIVEHPLDDSVGGWDNDPDIYDVNKDGFLDLVVTDESGNHEHAWIYFNPDGCGNFSQNTRVVAASDIESIDEIDEGDADGDGDIDLFTVGHSDYNEDVVLLINNGNSQSWSKCVICMNLNGSCDSPEGTGEAEGISVGDLDNDGDLDMAVTYLNNGSVYYFERLPNNANSGFGCNNIDNKNHRYNRYQIYAGGTGRGWDTWIADINNDGKNDIVATTQNEVMYFKNKGGNPPTFQRVTIENNPNANFYALWVKDINNDGDLDVIVTDRAGRVKIYRNDVDGNFPSNWWITLDNVNNPMGVVVADLEPDGDQDIFVASYVPIDKMIYVFENKSQSGYVPDNQNIDFERITPVNVPSRSYFGLGVGDVDSDADPDLVVRAGRTSGAEGLYWYSTELFYVDRGVLISNIVDINDVNKTWKLIGIELLGFDPLLCQQVIPNVQFYYRYSSTANYQDIYNKPWIGPLTNFPYTPPQTQMVKYIQYMIIMNSLNNSEKTPVIDEVKFIFDENVTPFSSPESESNIYFLQIRNKIKFLTSGDVKIIGINGSVYKQAKVEKGSEINLNKGAYFVKFISDNGKVYKGKIIVR